MPDESADPHLTIYKTLVRQAAQHADAIDELDTAYSEVIELVISRWREWWQRPDEISSRVHIEAKLDMKFRLCFPLAAHALNHIEASWGLRSSLPLVAKSSARVAFEHALTAQWVLLTEDGEAELKSQMDRYAYVHREKLVNCVRRLGQHDEPIAAAHGLTDTELTILVGEPQGTRANFQQVCNRFASPEVADLFYDLSRDLSEAVHPSYGLIQSYLTFDPSWTPRGVNWRGSGGSSGELIRAMAVSGLWALYALEVCRNGQPHAAEVVDIGERVGLPVDLRASDQHPERQPTSSHYWSGWK